LTVEAPHFAIRVDIPAFDLFKTVVPQNVERYGLGRIRRGVDCAYPQPAVRIKLSVIETMPLGKIETHNRLFHAGYRIEPINAISHAENEMVSTRIREGDLLRHGPGDVLASVKFVSMDAMSLDIDPVKGHRSLIPVDTVSQLAGRQPIIEQTNLGH